MAGLLGSRAPSFVQTEPIDVAGAVNHDYQNYLTQFNQSQSGGGLGGLLSLASLVAAPFTGGASLGVGGSIASGLGSLFGGTPLSFGGALTGAGLAQGLGGALSSSPTGPFQSPAQGLFGGLFG